MSVLYLALPIALVVAFAGVAAFIWSVKDGQLDDLQTPAIRMLQDDAVKKRTSTGQVVEKSERD